MKTIIPLLFYFSIISTYHANEVILNINTYLKDSSNHIQYYLEPSLSELPIQMSQTISQSFYYQLANLSKTIPLRIENHMGYIKILPFSFQRRSEVYSSKASIYSKFNQTVLNKLKDSDRYFLNCKLSWKSNQKFLLINIEASKEVTFEQFFEDYKSLISFLFSEHKSKVMFDEKDWIHFLKDRHFEGYEDELPDPFPAKKYLFNRNY